MRSSTGTSSSASRLRCWRGVSSSSATTTFASASLSSGLELVDLAGAEVVVRVRLSRFCISSPTVATPAVRRSSLSSSRSVVLRARRRCSRRAAWPGRPLAAGRSGTQLCGRCESVPRPPILESACHACDARAQRDRAGRASGRADARADRHPVRVPRRGRARRARRVACCARAARKSRISGDSCVLAYPRETAAARAARGPSGHGSGAGEHPRADRDRAASTGSARRDMKGALAVMIELVLARAPYAALFFPREELPSNESALDAAARAPPARGGLRRRDGADRQRAARGLPRQHQRDVDVLRALRATPRGRGRPTTRSTARRSASPRWPRRRRCR